MKVAFFKCRCLVCWKGFQVPKLPDSSYGDYLYFNKDTKLYSYFSWFNNSSTQDITNLISEFISKNEKLVIANDNSRGKTYGELFGLVSDGNNELINGFNRCPRCNFKLSMDFDTKTDLKEIEELCFTEIRKLDENEIQLLLIEKSKKLK